MAGRERNSGPKERPHLGDRGRGGGKQRDRLPLPGSDEASCGIRRTTSSRALLGYGALCHCSELSPSASPALRQGPAPDSERHLTGRWATADTGGGGASVAASLKSCCVPELDLQGRRRGALGNPSLPCLPIWSLESRLGGDGTLHPPCT